MRIPFTGVGTALITPFKHDGSVDASAVSRLARRQMDAGVHILVPCGTTGEAPTLSVDEKRQVIELVAAEANGRALVLAGAGGYNTKEVIHMAGVAKEAGADGLLSVTPYYNKPTQEGLFQHYSAIAESTDLPIIVYNVPGRTGCNVEPATLVRLAAVKNIVGVKEPSGDIAQINEICCLVPADFVVMSGDDAITLPLMALGGHGVISVVSNQMPSEMVQLVEAFERGALDESRHWHRTLMSLMQVNFVESNPGPVKFSMASMGLCERVYRLPMVAPQLGARDKILSVMRRLGLPVVAGLTKGVSL
ncbi:MAG: 4-hydroxy-tetrahydrodipicolinate synthase [Acidobacteria bacterium]|nr:4-hydroxy-tetrahydrodipicolinate synthase [Acidobacteriota bacterium]